MHRKRPLEATRRCGILFTLILFLTQPAGSAQNFSYYGRVVSVSDGDTITVLDRDYREHKIRLNGIDAPEASQDFGQVSRMNLAKMVFGREVLVLQLSTDKYERGLARVVFDRTDANLEQVRAGLAWFYRAYERELPEWYREALDLAEREARAARRGLWQTRSPQPPWEFRVKKRGGSGQSQKRVNRRGLRD